MPLQPWPKSMAVIVKVSLCLACIKSTSSNQEQLPQQPANNCKVPRPRHDACNCNMQRRQQRRQPPNWMLLTLKWSRRHYSIVFQITNTSRHALAKQKKHKLEKIDRLWLAAIKIRSRSHSAATTSRPPHTPCQTRTRPAVFCQLCAKWPTAANIFQLKSKYETMEAKFKCDRLSDTQQPSKVTNLKYSFEIICLSGTNASNIK